jgi:fibro-slime domain-containing protein
MKARTPGSIALLALLLAEGAGCVGDVNVQMAPGSDAAAGQSGNAGGAAGNGGAPGTGGAMAGGGAGGGGAIPGADGASGGGPFQMVGGGAGFAPAGGGGNGGQMYPDPGFVPTEYGAYALGAAITGAGTANTGVKVTGQACNTIAGAVRDFKGAADSGGHPDFETFSGSGPTLGLVQNDLGSDGKPVYTGVCEAAGKTAACPNGQQSTSKAAFDQWYRYTDGVNQPFIIYLQFTPNGNLMTFQSHAFFPVDNAGWGNNNRSHNYHFTTEIHVKFRYAGSETFSFIGDDDVWVFVNGKLAMDLGGLHTEAQAVVNLDSLGLTVGNEYALDLFHAERHTTQSNFRIDTNFAFTDCGTIIAPDIR